MHQSYQLNMILVFTYICYTIYHIVFVNKVEVKSNIDSDRNKNVIEIVFNTDIKNTVK